MIHVFFYQEFLFFSHVYQGFCAFAWFDNWLTMLVFFPPRTNGVEDQYSVIIRFDDQTSADGFYQHFNGRRFSSLEVCSGYVFWFRNIK